MTDWDTGTALKWWKGGKISAMARNQVKPSSSYSVTSMTQHSELKITVMAVPQEVAGETLCYTLS
jgi:hypothetical protein